MKWTSFFFQLNFTTKIFLDVYNVILSHQFTRMNNSTNMPTALLQILMLAWLCIVTSAGNADVLEELFRSMVLQRGQQRNSRGANELSINFAEGCEPLMSRCMSSLTLAPSSWTPDPAELRAEADKCSLEVCICAGSPATYDASTGLCKSSTSPDTLFEDNSKLVDRPEVLKYSQASCDQIERCSNNPCDIKAWVKYTKGLATCDTLWNCVKKQVGKVVDSCSTKVTVDKDNNTCDQNDICRDLSAAHAVIPEGSVDCGWEYQRTQTDPIITSEINTKCSTESCSCIRRGTVTNTCGNSTSPTCCVGGHPWDEHQLTSEFTSYSHLTCEEADLCVSAATYCKKVSQPEQYMPSECKGKAMEYQVKSSNCYAGESKTVKSVAEGTACPGAPSSICERLSAATTAKCDIIPLLHQSCDSQSSLASDGFCRCKSIPNHNTVCLKGSCLSTPNGGLVCTKVDNCTNHAVSATIIDGGCICSCQPNWYGDYCEVMNSGSKDSQLPTETIIGVAVGCAFLCVFMAAAICYVTKTPKTTNDCNNEPKLLSTLLQGSSDERVSHNVIQIEPVGSIPNSSQPPSQRVTPTHKDVVNKLPEVQKSNNYPETENIEMGTIVNQTHIKPIPGFDKLQPRERVNSMVSNLSGRRRSSGTLPVSHSAPSSRRSSRRSSVVDAKKPPRRRSSSGKKRRASAEYGLDSELRDLVPPKSNRDGAKTPTRRIRDADLSAALVSLENEFKSGQLEQAPTSSIKPHRRERANTALLSPTDFPGRPSRTTPRSVCFFCFCFV